MKTAYNPQSLENNYLQNEAEEALQKGIIDKAVFFEIENRYSSFLYNPNFFARIGLFILSALFLLLSTAFMGLLTHGFTHENFMPLLLLMAIGTYGLLEFLVRNNRHYNSGVDNLFLCAIIIYLTAFLFGLKNGDMLLFNFFILFIVSAYLSIRFTDAIMGVMATYFILGASIQLLLLLIGRQHFMLLAIAPMLIAPLLNLANSRIQSQKNNNLYDNCHKWIGMFLLFATYAAGNKLLLLMYADPSVLFKYLSMSLSGRMEMYSNMDGLYWTWTFAIPLLYIYRGTIKKNREIIRLGVILLVFSVYTFRHFFHIMQTSHALMLFGGLLILLCGVLLRYLKSNKKGFTSLDIDKEQPMFINLESLLIAEKLGAHQVLPQKGIDFGGGQTDGGGASGDI
jgi:hypothetical protein